jgi:hypothetical protein
MAKVHMTLTYKTKFTWPDFKSSCDLSIHSNKSSLAHSSSCWTHQIPTSCLPTLLIFIHIEHICSFFVAFFSATIDGRNLIFGHKLHIGMHMFNVYRNQLSRQTGSRNLTGPKTLPT